MIQIFSAMVGVTSSPFTRTISLAEWIEVELGVGERNERRAVVAQLVFLGLDAAGVIGFVAKDEQGVVYRGAEDVSPKGRPGWVAIFTSTGSPAAPIARHHLVFPRALHPVVARRNFFRVARAS